jgi:hypothetical protein
VNTLAIAWGLAWGVLGLAVGLSVSDHRKWYMDEDRRGWKTIAVCAIVSVPGAALSWAALSSLLTTY